jgi:hypothetical protein
MAKPTLYLSFDVEADGNNAMINNMLSLGIYALDSDGNEIFTFYSNFLELDGHIAERRCMEEFWAKNPESWSLTQIDKQNVHDVMKNLSKVLEDHSEEYKLVFVAMPSCFDWMFLKSYYEFAKCVDRNIKYDIGFNCICFSTLLSSYRKSKKFTGKQYITFKKSLYDIDSSKCHDALYDSKVQGIMFVKLIKIMDISF